MKAIKWLILLSVITLPGILHTAFVEENMFIVNQPSSGSAGYDFILEFSPQGLNLDVLIQTDEQILGMRDVAFDPLTGHLFYTVSSWGESIFEIREIDDSGNLLHTYTHPDFGGGNILLVFNKMGDLFIANDGYIFKREAGSTLIINEFALPYTGIGDLEIDSLGNLYLSDPFVNDIVYKIEPNGTVTSFADHTKGIKSPYGLAMDSQDNLYVANSSSSPDLKIIKLDSEGNATVFNDDIGILAPGILDMAFNAYDELLASCRSNETIIKFDATGMGTIYADSSDGLDDPASMVFIIYPVICTTDFDTDGDVDGSDLGFFIANYNSDCLEAFAVAFGGSY